MPAKRTPKKAAPVADVVPAEPTPEPEPPAVEKAAVEAKATADEAKADATEAPDGPDAEAVPMNRAERRAKGKVRPQPGFGPNKIVGSRGPASAQRNFANRRSG